jgi:hypothetical protein
MPISLVLGVGFKQTVLFMAWTGFVYGARPLLKWSIVATMAIGVLFIPYLNGFPDIVHHVLQYEGVPGFYGLSLIVPSTVAIIFLLVIEFVLPFILRARHIGLEHALLIAALVQLLLMPNIAVHYFVFPIAFGVLCKLRFTVVYTIAATLPFIFSVIHIDLYWYFCNLVWLCCLGWLIMELWTQYGESSIYSIRG